MQSKTEILQAFLYCSRIKKGDINMNEKDNIQSIYLRVPKELKLQVEMEAVRQNKTVNKLMKNIIEQYLQSKKK